MEGVMYSTCEDAERLYHWCPADAAADAYAEGAEYPIQVYGWRRRELTRAEIDRIARWVVSSVNEHLSDQEWADPECGHSIEPEFADALRDACARHLPNEHVWACERAPDLDVLITESEASDD